MSQLYFEKDIPQKLKDVLNNLFISQERIVLDYGDTKTKKSWGEEYDIKGRIGRSTGEKKIPLLVHNKRSLGGKAILTDCILSIKSSKKNGKVFYSI